MTPSDQARLLLRKAAQDMAVLDKLIDDPAIEDETLGYHAQQAAEKLIKALLALHGQDYPRSHNIGLLLDLLSSQGIALPGEVEALEALTPFGTVFRYDDLPFDDAPDRHSWPPLLHSLLAEVQGLMDASGNAGPEISS
jgi:HEPN domain-containing protein